MPRENTPGRVRKSTAGNEALSPPKDAVTEAEALREEYLERFDHIIADSMAVANMFTSSRALPEDELYRRMKQWQDSTKSLIFSFVRDLCRIYPDYEWVCLEAEKMWPHINNKCLFWSANICRLVSAAPVVPRTKRELAEDHQRIRSRNEALVRRAQYLALADANRRLETRESHATRHRLVGSRRDPLQQKFGRLMQRYPQWSNERIIGKYVDQGGEVSPQWRKHNHREADMLAVWRCAKCRHPLEAFLTRIRCKLGLPQRR